MAINGQWGAVSECDEKTAENIRLRRRVLVLQRVIEHLRDALGPADDDIVAQAEWEAEEDMKGTDGV